VLRKIFPNFKEFSPFATLDNSLHPDEKPRIFAEMRQFWPIYQKPRPYLF
jgi:hypothetical protein